MWNLYGKRKSDEKPPDGTCRTCYPFVKPMYSGNTLLAVLHNFEHKIPYHQMPFGGSGESWERPQAPKCLTSADVATERDEQLRNVTMRTKLIAWGEVPIPETLLSEFTNLKSAIMRSIQRYDIDEVDLDQKSSAILYNRPIRQPLARHLNVESDPILESSSDANDDGQPYLTMFVEAPLKRVSWSRNMYQEVLMSYFGTEIPTRLWDLPLVEEIVTEEMIRAYQHDMDRAKRGSKFVWLPQQTFAAYSVSWMGPNVNLAYCPHSDAYWICLRDPETREDYYHGRHTWKQTSDGNLVCETCNETTPHKCEESGKPFICVCPGCPLRNCMSCRNEREKVVKQKDMTWSWKWG
ncbi:MAG: hypothetical protein Q9221_007821 [Calogaya cf. arnoldii]